MMRAALLALASFHLVAAALLGFAAWLMGGAR